MYVIIDLSEMCGEMGVRDAKVRVIFIFRTYSVWEKKILKSNGFSTKFAKHQISIEI